ncbi:MAG: HD-GYP domain-containing protein [Clostridia bacterium]|nr:HD-GYP domain-containing protein [Clostridiales bacterium]
MAYLKAEDLKPGMVLKSDFINERGSLFLAEGTALTTHLIERIKELKVPYVSVVKDSDAKEVPHPHKTTYEIKTENFLKAYNNSNRVIRELFESVQSGRRLDLDDIRETVGIFIELIHDDENIVPKLQRIHMSDEYTYYHSINVSLMSMLIGKWLKMPVRELRKLGYTGVFHDIGKCKVPPEILNKPDNLNEKEWSIMKQHPVYGYNILKKNNVLSKDVLLGALMHHERKDGSGYPLGLKGNTIHTYGKIVAVADIFDAMMSDRVYRKKRPPLQVAEYIEDRSFDSLDPYISRVFLQGISQFYVGNMVRLNDGRVGKVVYIYPHQPTKPVVLAEGEFLDFSKKSDVTIVEIIG